ncbi:MAG: hypothetical protein QGI56_10595, partial [Dehalococcoidia bacterium]|nr:hypothetical protein [Dehalococcoidia bacterium]
MTTQERPLLSGLTDKDCVVQALDEYDWLGPDRFFEDHHWFDGRGKKRTFGPPQTWPLYYRHGNNPSQPYPSKAIAGVAY